MKKKILFILFIVYLFTTTLFLYVLNEKEIEYDKNKPLLECNEIDILYTWVNGSDPILINSRMKKLNLTLNEAIRDANRWRDLDGLKYSLRSYKRYVPFIRNIWIITDNQYPNWFNFEERNSNIKFLSHTSYFHNKSHLPTFNSNSIETNYFSLPDEISDCFLSLNDDVFFGAPVRKEDFYNEKGGFVIYEDNYAIEDYLESKEFFSYSLKYSNSLLDNLWGLDNKRKLAEHGAVLYHKKVFQEMRKYLSKEMDETSNHAIRNETDLQIPFLHLHFTKHFFRTTPPRKPINLYAGLIDNLNKMKILFKKISGEKYKTVCLNDGLPINPDPNVIDLYYKSLNKKFPVKGNWEM